MSSNPFARSGETAAPAVSEGAPEVDWDAPASFEAVDPEVVEEVESEAGEEDESFGSFDEPEEKQGRGDQKTIPYSRFAKVVSQRKAAQGELDVVSAKLAEVNAKLSAAEAAQQLLESKWNGNAKLAEFDANFMTTMETLARTNPEVSKVAAFIAAQLKAQGEKVQDPNQTAQEQVVETAVETPQADPAVVKLLERDASNSINTVLAEQGVKPHFVKAFVNDVLDKVNVSELVDATPAQIVEMAKAYFQSIDVPASEFRVPKAAGSKPETRGNARPAVVPSATPDGGEEAERPQYKTRDEFDKARSKRFASLAREVLG